MCRMQPTRISVPGDESGAKRPAVRATACVSARANNSHRRPRVQSRPIGMVFAQFRISDGASPRALRPFGSGAAPSHMRHGGRRTRLPVACRQGLTL